MKHVILGLDLGTTHIKAVLLRTDGETLLMIKEGIKTIRPDVFCAEQDSDAIWQAVIRVLKQVVVHPDGGIPEAIVISGAMQSLVGLNASYQPLSNAWIWSDFRAEIEAGEIRQLPQARSFYLKSGCPIQPVYHPARLSWIRKNNQALFSSTKFWVGIKDLIIYRLTGNLSTDCGMASSTGLLDLSATRWNQDLLDYCEISQDKLPDIISPQDLAGKLTIETASLTGLNTGLPIYAGSTDGVLANFGAGASSAGDTVVSVATGLAVRISSSKPWFDPLERTWTYLLRPGEYVIGGAGNNGGFAIQWIREQFYRDLPDELAYDQIFQDASSVFPGAEGVRFEPYFTGNRTPYWRADLSAQISGLTAQHSRQHIARAALEGIAREVNDIWTILKCSGLSHQPLFLTGPFCTRKVWLDILQAELGVQIKPVEMADASAIGAARLILGLD
jgi:gluconokinase